MANSGDIIDGLPTDENPPTQSEIQIVDTLFKSKQSTVQKFLKGIKDILVLGFIYIIFSLPQFNDLIYKYIPSTLSSPYILLLVKTLLFMAVYFLIKNLYLVRTG